MAMNIDTKETLRIFLSLSLFLFPHENLARRKQFSRKHHQLYTRRRRVGLGAYSTSEYI